MYKIQAEYITALELAAAFLKLSMGDEIKDIKIEKFAPRREGAYGRRGVGDKNGQDRFAGRSSGRYYGKDADKKKRQYEKYEKYDNRSKNFSSLKSGELKGTGRRRKDKNVEAV